MAFTIQTGKMGKANAVKCVIYGQSGIGKTLLSVTAPSPLILDFEKGGLSLDNKQSISKIYGDEAAKKNIDFISMDCNFSDDINKFENFKKDFNEFLLALENNAKEFSKYETIIFDSLTDYCESVLTHAKSLTKDGRKAYGMVQDFILPTIRRFGELNKHIVFICKEEISKDKDGNIQRIRPMLTGDKFPMKLPYLTDEVFYYRFFKYNGQDYRTLSTQPNLDFIPFEAKDRSGTLDNNEKPNLEFIFNKIQGVLNAK